MQPPAESVSPLSVQRAFVVQFRTESNPAHDRVAGRIEHVTSGQSALFQSWSDMQMFMVQMLTEVQAQSRE